MNVKGVILTGFLCWFWAGIGFAQSEQAEHDVDVKIPEIALLGLVSEQQTVVKLNAIQPNEAGVAMDFENVNSDRIWINYSSIISKSAPKRKVVAFIQGDIPKGIRLKVEASEFNGTGKGNIGRPTGSVVLSNQPSDVIKDIGSCYTGKGINNGHCLTYKIEKDNGVSDYAMLVAQKASFNVVYTLTDYN